MATLSVGARATAAQQFVAPRSYPRHAPPRALARPSREARLRRSCATRSAPPDGGHHAPSTREPPDLQHSKVAPVPAVRHFDFLVIGSGIAGLSYALKVAEHGRVGIITKDTINEGCTQYAQGGVCAVLDAVDSVENHVRDTLVAGAFLNDAQAVEVVCREGPARVLELAALGAAFTRGADGALHLTREGGHSHRRIVHAADATGAEIQRALVAAVRRHPNISCFEGHAAVDLLVDAAGGGVPHCFGADVLDVAARRVVRFVGLATMLASGGAGQMYPNTTNPAVATGDGIAMAYRAGAPVSNLEFVQFHPTALHGSAGPATDGRAMLITEAVRGEGGVLLNMQGERFMRSVDERLELAPRDIVARAIHAQLQSSGDPHVWLDISHKPRAQLLDHFPNIAAACAARGIDIAADPIPVVPAQHYTCGGVVAGLRGEATGLQGLYVCGEVSCSGLHGANRLASNSLLEGLVFAARAVGPSVAHAEYAAQQCARQLRDAAAVGAVAGAAAAASPPAPLPPAVAAWADAARDEVRALMWRAAGIVRRTAPLAEARARLGELVAEVGSVYAAHATTPSPALIELRNLVECAQLTVACALQRRESRGGHYNADYPSSVASECRASVVVAAPSVVAQVRRGGGGGGGGGGGARRAVVAAPRRAATAVGAGAGGALVHPASTGAAAEGDEATALTPAGGGGGAGAARRGAPAPSKAPAARTRGARDLSVRSTSDKTAKPKKGGAPGGGE